MCTAYMYDNSHAPRVYDTYISSCAYAQWLAVSRSTRESHTHTYMQDKNNITRTTYMSSKPSGHAEAHRWAIKMPKTTTTYTRCRHVKETTTHRKYVCVYSCLWRQKRTPSHMLLLYMYTEEDQKRIWNRNNTPKSLEHTMTINIQHVASPPHACNMPHQ